MEWLQLIVQKLTQLSFHRPPRAVFYHGLRVYYQFQVWKQLSDVDKDPIKWGWVIKNKMLRPIMTDNEAGPPDLLQIVRCGRKGPCGKSYSWR